MLQQMQQHARRVVPVALHPRQSVATARLTLQDKGWDFLDSADPKREWDGWSFNDIADPPKGGEGYPRLLVENRVYCSRAFRKLHLEVAVCQDGLHVLHVVMFPRCAAHLRGIASRVGRGHGAAELSVRSGW